MRLITLKEVDSTNIYAKNNIENFDDKTVICAIRQTAGRGRLSRKWIDLGEGNLFLSFILKPSDSFNSVYANLTQYLSIVLCQVIESYGLKTQIKWPNDVLINNKKVAGILCETIMQGKTFKGLVLGIGVNLNAKQADVDNIPDKAATALNLELNKTIDKNEFLNKLTNLFFENYDEFLDKGFEVIKTSYISRAEFLGKEITINGINITKEGIAKDINDSGELILKKDDEEIVLTIGDII